MGVALIMEYYGYIKPSGTPPENNFWKKDNEITLNNNTVVYGYEGLQSESDENVEIIGDAATFNEWLKENIVQSNIQQ